MIFMMMMFKNTLLDEGKKGRCSIFNNIPVFAYFIILPGYINYLSN